MISLIDGDLIAFRSAASCEKQGVVTEDLSIAQARANETIHRLCQTTGGTPIIVLSGGENFRYKINPEYKANRVDQKRPTYLEAIREFLVVEHGAEVTDGIEADDRLGILATEYSKQDVPNIICSLDKDLRQIPGWHYSWEISATNHGKMWVRPEEKLLISPQEGLFNFYWQMIMGDRADNVFGFDGKARQRVPNFLDPLYQDMQMMENELELFSCVYDLYHDKEHFFMNGACLWIKRSEDDDWLKRVEPIMEELGLKEDSIRS